MVVEAISLVMSEVSFKAMLGRVKEQFAGRLLTVRRGWLSIEEVAQLLYKYLNGEPLGIREALMRSSGKTQLSWDDLLQFLQEELAVLQAVKKNEYSPLSATEIADRHTSEFAKLIAYVKTKETNSIQALLHLPHDNNHHALVAVAFQKEIVFYDPQAHALVNSLVFTYTHQRQKLLEKDKAFRLHSSVKVDADAEGEAEAEASDAIHEIVNIGKRRVNSLALPPRPVNFLTNNLKSSVRGSELSSEKSNDKMMFRRGMTESLERRKAAKATVTKLKNDETHKLFHFFEHSSLENSIQIAHAFVEARTNFHKHIVLPNSYLQPERKERNFELSSAKFHKNYQRELNSMKRTNRHLSNVRANFSQEVKTRHETEPALPRQALQRSPLRGRRQEGADPLQMGSKQLGILAVCFYEQFLLISLFNREVRLLRLKKSLNRIQEDPIFEKSFKEVVTYVELYRSKNKQAFRIALGLEREGQSLISVYHLDESMQLKEKVFEHEFSFSAKYQSVLPFGVALFSELGQLGLVELNCALRGEEEQVSVCAQLSHPETGYRLSIGQVRINAKQTSLFLSCSSGYAYLYDRYTKALKYHTRVCQSPVLDLALIHHDQELLLLYANGNMAILSTFHMERVFLYQAYGEISNESKIFVGLGDEFYVYAGRTIFPYSLTQNEEKKFNNLKSVKVLKSRLKLKTKEKRVVEKSRVFKIVEGRGGEEDFLAMILENGEIIVFDGRMEYIGSYFYFKVLHIAEIYCNKLHQFLAILLDSNTVQVVNLYTQSLVFTVKAAELDLPLRPSNRPDSSLHSTSVNLGKNRPQRPSGVGVTLVNFMDKDISDCFLSVISKAGRVTHYSQKGVLLSTVNLEDRLGDTAQGPMLYDEEELVIGSEGNLLVLYRKSYNRKCVVRVSRAALVRLAKCRWKHYSLCVMDSTESIFLVDPHLKEVSCLHEGGLPSRNEHVLFNPGVVLRVGELEARVLLRGGERTQLQVDHEKYLYSMMGDLVIQVSKANGKIRRLNFALQQFEDLLY